jgi:hypothetical protein
MSDRSAFRFRMLMDRTSLITLDGESITITTEDGYNFKCSNGYTFTRDELLEAYHADRLILWERMDALEDLASALWD